MPLDDTSHSHRAHASAARAVLAGQGLLRIEDPDWAAIHFVRLTTGGRRVLYGTALTRQEITEMVTAGVRAFLHGYTARPADSR